MARLEYLHEVSGGGWASDIEGEGGARENGCGYICVAVAGAVDVAGGNATDGEDGRSPRCPDAVASGVFAKGKFAGLDRYRDRRPAPHHWVPGSSGEQHTWAMGRMAGGGVVHSHQSVLLPAWLPPPKHTGFTLIWVLWSECGVHMGGGVRDCTDRARIQAWAPATVLSGAAAVPAAASLPDVDTYTVTPPPFSPLDPPTLTPCGQIAVAAS